MPKSGKKMIGLQLSFVIILCPLVANDPTTATSGAVSRASRPCSTGLVDILAATRAAVVIVGNFRWLNRPIKHSNLSII